MHWGSKEERGIGKNTSKDQRSSNRKKNNIRRQKKTPLVSRGPSCCYLYGEVWKRKAVGEKTLCKAARRQKRARRKTERTIPKGKVINWGGPEEENYGGKKSNMIAEKEEVVQKIMVVAG